MATIITKNSSTASSVPTAAQLVQGELAVNVTDKRLFTENSSGTVVELGTNPSSLTLPNGVANAVCYLNGSKVLTTGSALTWNTNVLAATGSNAGYSLEFDCTTTPLVIRADDNTGGSIAPIAFSLGNGSTFSEQARLTSTGLGIGTSSPQYKGHFFTNANSGYGIQVGGTSGVAGDYTGILMSAANASGASPYYSGAIRIQTTVNSPSTQEPVMAFMLQDAGTFALANMTEKMRLTGSGNLGLGVTPTNNTLGRTLQVGQAGAWVAESGTNRWWLANNWYFNSGDKYINNGFATLYSQQNGTHQWFTAPSGTAGNAISFTQAMTLDASGNLGLGATSLSAYLTLQKSSSSVYDGTTLSPSGVGNTLFIDNQDNTTGSFGQIVFRNGASGQVWNRIVSVRVGSGNGALAFVTGTSSAAAERARIDSSGNLLVGTTSSWSAGVRLQVTAPSGSNAASFTVDGTTSRSQIYFRNDNGVVGTIATSGTSTAYNTSSDYRLKENIQPMTGALAKVAALKPCTYKWKADGSDGEGFIAHELAEVCPQAVTGEKDAVDADGNPVYQGIDTSFLVATLTAAIQELKAEFDAYKASHP